MNRSAALVVALGVSLAGCASNSTATQGGARSNDGPRAPYRGALPDVNVEGMDGKVASLREVVKGKVAVIDLWATWCGACHEVTARAIDLAKSSHDPGLVVIGVDQGEDRGTVSSFVDGAGIPYPIFIDHQFEVADGVGSDRLPTIIIVGADGNVKAVSHHLDGRVLDLLGELLPGSVPPKRDEPAADHGLE